MLDCDFKQMPQQRAVHALPDHLQRDGTAIADCGNEPIEQDFRVPLRHLGAEPEDSVDDGVNAAEAVKVTLGERLEGKFHDQYSSASMMVMTRTVSSGLDGSGDR